MIGEPAKRPRRCPACGSTVGAEPVLIGEDRLHRLAGTFGVLVCERCGTGVTTPPVLASDLAGLYPEGYAAHGLPAHRALGALARALAEVRHRRALRRLPLRLLRDRDPGRLLDVGSGRGDLADLARRLGWDVTGLEPSPVAAAEAGRRGVATEIGTLETAGARLSPPYDVVVFQHSLEHLADPAADARRALALLRPGGAVLVTVPHFGSWQARRFGTHWFHLDLPRHRTHFTAAGLRALLAAAGFAPVLLTTSASADGLPMSVEYRMLGGGRRGRSRYAEIAAVLASTPLTAAVNRAAREGDLLHAVGHRP